MNEMSMVYDSEASEEELVKQVEHSIEIDKVLAEKYESAARTTAARAYYLEQKERLWHVTNRMNHMPTNVSVYYPVMHIQNISDSDDMAGDVIPANERFCEIVGRNTPLSPSASTFIPRGKQANESEESSGNESTLVEGKANEIENVNTEAEPTVCTQKSNDTCEPEEKKIQASDKSTVEVEADGDMEKPEKARQTAESVSQSDEQEPPTEMPIEQVTETSESVKVSDKQESLTETPTEQVIESSESVEGSDKQESLAETPTEQPSRGGWEAVLWGKPREQTEVTTSESSNISTPTEKHDYVVVGVNENAQGATCLEWDEPRKITLAKGTPAERFIDYLSTKASKLKRQREESESDETETPPERPQRNSLLEEVKEKAERRQQTSEKQLRAPKVDEVVRFAPYRYEYNIVDYVAKLERVIDWYPYTDDERQQILRSKFTGDASDAVQAMVARDYYSLREQVVDHFGKPSSYHRVTKALETRRQYKNETGRSYVLAMQSISANQPIDEADVVGHCLRGLRREYTGDDKFRFLGCNTIKALKEKLRLIEEVWAKDEKRTNTVRAIASGMSQQERLRKGLKKPLGYESRSCHRCSEEGHLARDCVNEQLPYDGCMFCHKSGHWKADCADYKLYREKEKEKRRNK